MEVRKVSKDDAIKCAQLIKIMDKGRWDLSASDIVEFTKVKAWVMEVATAMARDLQGEERSGATVSPPPAPMKIKSMGKLPVKSSSKKRK